MLDPSILILKTSNMGLSIIISQFNSQNSYIIRFDYFCGQPLHYGIEGYDVFPNEAEAKQYISSCSKIESEYRGKYLIGVNNIKDRFLSIVYVDKVKEIGKIMGKHTVYSIVNFRNIFYKLENDKYYDDKYYDQLAEDEKHFFSDFPIKDLHYFCPTFDLTSIIGSSSKNAIMIWNLSLSKPFKKFGIPCCIDIIQGAFKSYKLNESTYLFSIIRKCCRFSGFQDDESNEDSKLNALKINEFEIEYVIENLNEGIYEFKTQVLRKCLLPHFFSSPGSTPDKVSITYTNFFESLIRSYNINQIEFLDLTENRKFDPQLLKDTINIISTVIKVELNQFEWNQNDFFGSAKYVVKLIVWKINEFGFNKIVWINDCPTIIEKQKGFFVISDQSGFDQSTIASFLVGLYSFSNYMHEYQFTNMCPNTFESLRELKIVPDLFEFFLDSNRKLGQISLVPTSFNEKEFGQLFNIKEGNFLDRQNYQWNNNTTEILKSFLNIPKDALLYSEEDCVSVVPPAHVMLPSTLNLRIFSLGSNDTCSIKTGEPIIISLSKPCFISKIILKIPKVSGIGYNILKPSSVSIRGGLYINRMFPLFEDVLIVDSDFTRSIIISSARESSGDYESAIYLNEIEKVRYLQFNFHSEYPKVTIGNILVYGNCDTKKKDCIKKNVNDNIGGIASKEIQLPSFLEDVTPDVIAKWEKHRLFSILTFDEFALKMVERNLNPFKMTVSSLLEQKKRKVSLQSKTSCSICGKRKNTYQCEMCGKFFCNSCKQPFPSLAKPMFCSDCYNVKNMISGLIPLLDFLKARKVVNQFPFIGNFDEIFDREEVNREIYRSRGNLIGTIFISEPPSGIEKGDKLMPAEFILNPKNERVWSPRESCIPLLIYLKQESNLDTISISCTSPVKAIIDDQEFEFIPPFTEHKLYEFQNDLILKMTLVGFPIEIKNISVYGSPVTFHFPSVKNDQVLYRAKFIPLPAKTSISKEKSMICFKLEQAELVSGLNFEEIMGGQTILLDFVDEADLIGRRIVSLNLPKGKFSECNITFKKAYKMKEFNLWFNPSLNKVKGLRICPLCNVRNSSSPQRNNFISLLP